MPIQYLKINHGATQQLGASFRELHIMRTHTGTHRIGRFAHAACKSLSSSSSFAGEKKTGEGVSVETGATTPGGCKAFLSRDKNDDDEAQL